MKIAVLSGKGGAGKTMVAVNLAAAAGHAAYIDCDVEEPNGRLFLKPEHLQQTPVCTPLPSFDAEKCTGCRKCVEFCRFHALIYIREKPMIFPEVCHSCGGCMLVCPEHAVTERQKEIGFLETGSHGTIQVITGELNPGETSGIPIIRQALNSADSGITVIDCPPGSACSVMECVCHADYCLLVAEPTAFGFHNFQMVYELVTLLGKPCGVVINKGNVPYEPLEQFCIANRISILDRIDYDPLVASAAAQGKILCQERPDFGKRFRNILSAIGGECP